jgi:hypothetical protein
MDDGFDIVAVSGNGYQGFVLSGLVENQEYAVQLTGVIRHGTTAGASARNMGLSINGSDPLNALLFATPIAAVADNGGYSQYATFIAGASGTAAVDIWETSTGNKDVSGLIVSTIPEPATLGMVVAFGAGIVFIRRRLCM